jgi:hypothetical protein
MNKEQENNNQEKEPWYMNRSLLALVIVGVVVAMLVVLVGVLSVLGLPCPDQVWNLITMGMSMMVGVAGAQALNGQLKKAAK